MSTDRVEIRPGYEVPRFIVGLWQLSEGHRTSPLGRTEVMDLLSRLVDDGFTTFDCADIYTGVEDLLGTFRAAYAAQHGSSAADRIQIHTKFVPDRDALADIDKPYVERIIDRSLRRLGVDRLDLVQFAWWDYDTPGYVETARWLEELRGAGKIRFLGVTNFDVPHLEEIIDAGVSIATQQVQYSLLDRRPENGMAQFCAANEIGLLCYGALAGGFLSDRYLGAATPNPPYETRSLTKYRLIIDECAGWERYQELLQMLAEMAERTESSIAQLALRWALERTSVSAALVGMSQKRSMRDCAKALEIEVRPKDWAPLNAWGDRGPMPAGDVFGFERQSDGPHASIMKYDLNRD